MPDPLRLIDLHTDWILQYAPETTLFDPALYDGVSARLGQSEGYLQGTRIAILSCYRRAADWAGQPDPWSALGALLTRIEAEFPGRLLIDRADLTRCLDEPEGLCWGIIGVEGFDALVRTSDDLARLPGLFTRGGRLFQPVYHADNNLAGSSTPGDERGLTDLGRSFLETLERIGAESAGPKPLVDLAHLNPQSAGATLAWFEADGTRASRLIPVYSHGALAHPGFSTPRAITSENLQRLRALGGVVGFSVGPPFYSTADELKAGLEAAAAIPFRGRAGFEGLAIGTDFLGVDQTLPGLGNVPEVIDWLTSTFDPTTAAALVHGNAFALIERMLGGEDRG